MKKTNILFVLAFIIFSCTSNSKTESETENIDVSSLEAEDVLDEILAIEELAIPEDLEELGDMDEFTEKSANSGVKVEKEAEADKSAELKVEEKKIKEKRVEVIKEKATESPLKGKNCDEILEIFQSVTAGSTVVDYDIMNDPYFVICKDKGPLKEEFTKSQEDDIDEEPW